MSGINLFFSCRTIAITLLYLLIGGDLQAQNLYLQRDLQIDYLALEVDIDENKFTQDQIKNLKRSIETVIADHNSSDPKFNIYLVDKLEYNQRGISLKLDTLIVPTKRQQRSAFIVSMVGLIAVPIGILYASGGQFIFLFWINPKNQIPNTTLLSQKLSSRSGQPLKMRLYSNGGWFRSTQENEASITDRLELRLQRVVSKIHTTYRPPKEIRKRKAIEMNLPVKFQESFVDSIQEVEWALPVPTPEKSILTDTIEERKEGISWFSYDASSGVSIPVAGDINYSFTPAFSLRTGPKWKFNEDLRLKPYFGLDLMIKNLNGEAVKGEFYFNSKWGIQLEIEILEGTSSKFDLYPFINLNYNTGAYNFTNYDLDDPNNGVTSLRHRGVGMGTGIGMTFSWFTACFYYNYYMPQFRHKSGPTYGDLDFDRSLNMSTIEIQLGFSLH